MNPQSNSLIGQINYHYSMVERDEYKNNVEKDDIVIIPGTRNLSDTSNKDK